MDETLRREVRFLTTRLGAMAREQCGRHRLPFFARLRLAFQMAEAQPRQGWVAQSGKPHKL